MKEPDKNLLIQILNSVDQRSAEILGKTYLGFTPHPGPDINEYYIGRHPSFDVTTYYVFTRRNKMSTNEKSNVADYVSDTLARLLYNDDKVNEEFGELGRIFSEWVMLWMGNDKIKEGFESTIVDSVKDVEKRVWGSSKDDLIHHIYGKDTKKHWYPLNVELEKNSKRRSSLKLSIRTESIQEAIVEDIKTESDNYSNIMLGV